MAVRRGASLVAASVVVALLSAVPFLWAWRASGAVYDFAGFLINPLDGLSYLAKMREGWQGSWLFTLPFTPHPGPGTFLFTYFLLLGHLARGLDLSLLVTYHAARILAAIFLLVTAWFFYRRLGLGLRQCQIAWWMTAVGSGLGWVAVPLGGFPADLWVAEYVPFLAILSSAHFPLALALLLWVVMLIALFPDWQGAGKVFTVAALGFVLAPLQPFLLLPAGLALTVWTLVQLQLGKAKQARQSFLGLLAAALGTAPWAAYYLWATSHVPQLANWAAQNQTPTPALWNIALTVGLPGLLAAIGIFSLLRRWRTEGVLSGPDNNLLILSLWAVLTAVLIYLPFALQRRLMGGWFFPLVGLGAPVLANWSQSGRWASLRLAGAFALLLPSNLVVLSAISHGVISHDPSLFLTQDESRALEFLEGKASPQAVVLAAPEMGTFVPGRTGMKVLYGHPFETPDATRMRQMVESFFAQMSQADQEAFLRQQGIDYIFYGTRERKLGALRVTGLTAVFQSPTVVIYETHPPPSP
jgi:hypothetical protein